MMVVTVLYIVTLRPGADIFPEMMQNIDDHGLTKGKSPQLKDMNIRPATRYETSPKVSKQVLVNYGNRTVMTDVLESTDQLKSVEQPHVNLKDKQVMKELLLQSKFSFNVNSQDKGKKVVRIPLLCLMSKVTNEQLAAGTAQDWAASSLSPDGWLAVSSASINCTNDTVADPISLHPYFKTAAVSPGTFLFPPLSISPTDVCSKGAVPLLLIMVLSSFRKESLKERQSVRSTYGVLAKGGQWPGKPMPASVRLVFLLGKPPSEEERKRIEDESRKYGDLLVGDFVDSYRNLTLKVLLGLRWALDHCSKVGYVMKVDDDIFVNLPLLTTFLLSRGENNAVYGHTYDPSSLVMREGKWSVPSESYPMEVYPIYMSGAAYVISVDAVRTLLETSSRFPVLPVEDVYITGILAVAGGVRRMSTSGFTFQNEGKSDYCDFLLDVRFVGNGFSSAEKNVLWNILRKYDDGSSPNMQNSQT